MSDRNVRVDFVCPIAQQAEPCMRCDNTQPTKCMERHILNEESIF